MKPAPVNITLSRLFDALNPPRRNPPSPSVTSQVMFDAHVRLRLDELKRIEPWHLHSGADVDPFGTGPPDPGVALDGYTEWAADATRTLSMGWDWTFDPETRQLTGLWRTLRTNIMVVDDAGVDLGRERTQQCIADLMGSRNWEATTAEAVGLPPPFCH